MTSEARERTPRAFVKMHGLGNDFVVIDGRKDNFDPSPDWLRAVSDRKRGVGCDQVIVLRHPRLPERADIFMGIYNNDGTQVGACGNATRCVAQQLFAELAREQCTIETVSGFLNAWRDASDAISVDFGTPKLEWQQIPLARNLDTLHVPLELGPLADPCCVSMGNPHAVFFVTNVDDIKLSDIGPILEFDELFPEKCNIEIVHVQTPNRLRMRVWERGTGITEACGSGACAVLVAAVRRGLSSRRATVVLDGGELEIEWRADDHVIMTGPAAVSFEGELSPSFSLTNSPNYTA